MFENKDSDKVNVRTLRMQDLGEDFISKIEDNTKRSKARSFEPEIKVRKIKLDTEELSILYNKEAFEPAIFAIYFSKNVDSKLVIQTKFDKKVHNKLVKVKDPRLSRQSLFGGCFN